MGERRGAIHIRKREAVRFKRGVSEGEGETATWQKIIVDTYRLINSC